MHLRLAESGHQRGRCNYEDSLRCHATVSHLTSGLATVVATCQQGSEHMLEVSVGEVDGPATQIGDTRN